MTIDVRAFITKHEGVRYVMYKDSLGIPTIGVGFNLTRPDAKSIIEGLGLDYQATLRGLVKLTKDQVNVLLDKDIAECLVGLKQIFPTFDSMPDNAKAVLIDLRFNLGQKGLLGFPNTLQDFKDGNYKTAALRLSQSKWAKQVKIRATENISLLNAI